MNQINQPILDKNAVDFIVNQMTVFFDGPREDTNATTYGKRIENLRDVIVGYMEDLYNQLSADDTDDPVPNKEGNDVDENVNEFIKGDYFVDQLSADDTDDPVPNKEGNDVDENVNEFIKGDYFVDGDALKEWLKQKGNTRKKFDRVKEKVVDMFEKLKHTVQNDMVDNWVKELRTAFLASQKTD